MTVEVGVDPAWLSDPTRIFPVTVDPTVTTVLYSLPGYGRQNMVWEAVPSTAYTTPLDAGNIAGRIRTLLWFNLGITPAPNLTVTGSYLRVYNKWAPTCLSSFAALYGVGGPWNQAVTWNTRPARDAAGLVSAPSFSYGASGCPANFGYYDTTSLAQRWLHGATNYGLELSALDETSYNASKGFDDGASGLPPVLVITYKHQPDAAVDIPPSPADGAVLSSPTPTLAVAPGYSPDGDPVSFDYLVTTSPDALSGNRVVDSGWTPQTSWPVPLGALADGMTYWWQVITNDGTVSTFQPSPRSFRVDLGLGTKGPMPHDDLGPARVNLSNGNLVVGAGSPSFPTVGGSAGLSYTYNSEATAGAGLTGAYYPETSGQTPPPTEPTGNPVLVRRDANVDSLWAASGPGPLPPTNFRVRWKGTITLPSGGWGTTNAAAWTFGAYAQDGVVIKVNGATVVNRWQNETWSSPPTPPGFYGPAQQLIAGRPYSIQIDYYTHSSFGFMALLAYGPDNKVGIVPPSWLRPDNDPLPSGWTMAAANVHYVSARISDAAVTLMDSSGASHLYTAKGNGGYSPPPEEDATLGTDSSGNLTLAADDGLTYVFDPAGQLVGATAATDDRYPSSPSYVWFPEVGNRQAGDPTKPIDPTKPMRLVAITDPASGRQHTLRYAGAPVTGQPPAPFDPAAPCPSTSGT
ncbi:MAG TPA: DNRLRE domain-containing protein, partial [Acidimicrobiales bacterium]